jgi:acetyl esterase/lipase
MDRAAALLFVLASASLSAQQSPSSVPQPAPTTAATAANSDTSYIDAQGTAHVTRVVPLPDTISPEAKQRLARVVPDQAPLEPLEERRLRMEASQAAARTAWTKICPSTAVDSTVAGVPVRIITPDGMPAANNDMVLENLHGGSFNSDSGSYSESIPIAYYTKIEVVAVLYRLAPEHPFPAAVDDAVAVYKELLKTHKPQHIVLYGTSAGAILTAEVAVKLKQLGLPMPAALGIFSALGDFARNGDSWSIFTLNGLSGHLEPPPPAPHDSYYVTGIDPRDPVVSPIYADLHGLPPTLFISSERDALLSGTANLHRAYLHAGVDARLVVFDALPHAFWYDPKLPESIEANHFMADFFLEHLKQ